MQKKNYSLGHILCVDIFLQLFLCVYFYCVIHLNNLKSQRQNRVHYQSAVERKDKAKEFIFTIFQCSCWLICDPETLMEKEPIELLKLAKLPDPALQAFSIIMRL